MTSRRDIEDGRIDFVRHHIQNLADQQAGANDHGLSRLEVNRDAVLFPEVPHQLDQAIDVVTVPGDVMAATEVDPFHRRQELAELFLENRCRSCQRFEEVLAECMEMQAFNAGQ